MPRIDPTTLYVACVLGAAALFLALRPGKRSMRIAGALIGLGVFAWLLATSPRLLGSLGGATADTGEKAAPPGFFFLMFSLIAVASAVRMVTHERPVYSALYFVLVVLSSAALFLLLQAEFMAFALVIVYAGAILITYMFVIMLAQQAPTPERDEGEADYDVYPREPAMACVVGFILLAVLTNMIYAGVPSLPPAPSPNAGAAMAWQRLNLMPREIDAIVRDLAPGAAAVSPARVEVAEGGQAYISIMPAAQTMPTRLPIPAERLPSNVQRVGLDLVAKFPVSLELAGVILLMAMFGAVVLARKQIELGEDEIREAAGMRRLGFHAEEATMRDGGVR
jgi:NADH-quinone oxidoreductase subunit J